MKGVLLAAGKGVRLSPLTDHTPKPLLVAGGKPILQRIIEGLSACGVDDLAVIIGHRGNQVIDYFESGSRFNVRIRYYHQTTMNGTAHAVLPAAGFLGNAPFFLGYGDILMASEEYGKLISVFNQYPTDSIVAGTASDTPWTGGVLIQDGNRLTGIVEKPPRGMEPGNLINAGVMILQPAVLEHVQNVRPSSRGEYELTDAVQALARQSVVRIHIITSFWSDIGTREKLAEADAYFSRSV